MVTEAAGHEGGSILNLEEPTQMAWKRMLPNALTLTRVALAVVFFAMLHFWRFDLTRTSSMYPSGRGVDGWLLGAAGVFVLAAITDALDGHLARTWRVVSLFGRVMDPFADKLLVIGAFVFLAGPSFAVVDTQGRMMQVSGVESWMAVVILGRELLITSLRGVFESAGVSFAASPSGKWKMILQSVCVPLIMVLIACTQTIQALPDGGGPVLFARTTTGQVVVWVVWATVVATAWSGLPYVLRGIRESGKLRGMKA